MGHQRSAIRTSIANLQNRRISGASEIHKRAREVRERANEKIHRIFLASRSARAANPPVPQAIRSLSPPAK